jgi:hypothetical protein
MSMGYIQLLYNLFNMGDLVDHSPRRKPGDSWAEHRRWDTSRWSYTFVGGVRSATAPQA